MLPGAGTDPGCRCGVTIYIVLRAQPWDALHSLVDGRPVTVGGGIKPSMWLPVFDSREEAEAAFPGADVLEAEKLSPAGGVE